MRADSSTIGEGDALKVRRIQSQRNFLAFFAPPVDVNELTCESIPTPATAGLNGRNDMRTTTKAEYDAILAAGILADRLRDENDFAAACYNDNTVDELLDALRGNGNIDADCRNWGISREEFAEAVRRALAGRADDYEAEHDMGAYA